MTRYSAKQVQALELLAGGQPVVTVANQVKVSERQVYRWLEKPEFRDQLRTLQTETMARVYGRLLAMAETALDGLEDVLERPAAKGQNVRRLTAVSILDQLVKVKETLEFEERLTELERVVFSAK